MKAIERIKNLVKTLPEKDRKLAYKFIDTRQFESLYELVNSAIYITRKAHKEKLEGVEYLDVAEMTVLQSEIINYIDRMGYNDFLENEEF